MLARRLKFVFCLVSGLSMLDGVEGGERRGLSAAVPFVGSLNGQCGGGEGRWRVGGTLSVRIEDEVPEMRVP